MDALHLDSKCLSTPSTCASIYTYKHRYTCTQIHIHRYVCTHYMHTDTHVYIHMCLQVHTLFSIFVYVSVCVSPLSPFDVSLHVLMSLSALCLSVSECLCICLSSLAFFHSPCFPLSPSLFPLSSLPASPT